MPSVPTLPRQTGVSSQVLCTSPSANEDDGGTSSDMSGSHQMAVDGMHSEDDERSVSGSESNSDLPTRDDSSMILARLEDPSTTLEERKDLVELLLDGARREPLLHLVRRLEGYLTVTFLAAYRPFPVVPGIELPEVPSLFGRGRQ